MTRTMKRVVQFLVIYLGLCGIATAGAHKDYGTVARNCDERSEAVTLAETIYYEAGNQSQQGKIAVAFVVLNRVKLAHSNICEVVRQRGQFSWVTNTALRSRPKNETQWKECEELARAIILDPSSFTDPTNGATAFRMPVDTSFSVRWVLTIRIGGHLFYRDPANHIALDAEEKPVMMKPSGESEENTGMALQANR